MPSRELTRTHTQIDHRVLALPELRDKLAAQGFELAPAMASAAFGKIIADDMKKWLPIVKASGAVAD